MVKYADIYAQCTGVRLFPGSLNVVLDEEYRLPPNRLRIEPADLGGRVRMNLVRCRFLGMTAFIIRTDQNEAGIGDHAHTVVEIAAAVRLRDEFGLSDGDIVEIQVDDG